jgi:3-oxoadipate enol-lactonase
MPYLQIQDANYYYEQIGSGEPLLLIAGYSCDHTFWDDVAKALNKNLQLILFDNRGVGQTKDHEKPFSLEEMANDTIALIQKLGYKKLSIVGQSMGGIVAQLIAKQSPDLIDKLIILNSAAHIHFRALYVLETFLKLLHESAPIETVIEASLPWFYSGEYLEKNNHIKKLKEKIMSNPHPQSISDLDRQFHALKNYRSEQNEKAMKIPTLIISSSEDLICPGRESEKLIAQFPHAQFESIFSGHASAIENPDAVLHAIQDFLLN